MRRVVVDELRLLTDSIDVDVMGNVIATKKRERKRPARDDCRAHDEIGSW